MAYFGIVTGVNADRANALKPAVDSHLAALRTALVGERYPEA